MANKGKTNIYLIKTSMEHKRSLTQVVVGVVLEETVAGPGHDVSNRAVSELGQVCSGER